MAAWAGWQPASWNRWLPWTCPDTDTESITSTECSARKLLNGFQREKPDRWKTNGTPLQIQRPEEAIVIPLYGRVENARDRANYRQSWLDYQVVVGVPNDMPVVGYNGQTVNYLRLFQARSSEDFDIDIFNRGDYIRAVEQKIASENISRVLYPSDSVMAGKELRLVQEYFLVACAVRDIARNYLAAHNDFAAFPEKVAIQMNDTHPALAVAELMRVLVDENNLEWEDAWEITQKTVAYTNHTLLPEALEKWSVASDGAGTAAPHADHLRHQSQFPAHPQRLLVGRWREAAQDVDHRGRARQKRAHGAPGHRGLARGQWRFRPAQRPDPHHRWCRSLPSYGPTNSATRPTAWRRGAGC